MRREGKPQPRTLTLGKLRLTRPREALGRRRNYREENGQWGREAIVTWGRQMERNIAEILRQCINVLFLIGTFLYWPSNRHLTPDDQPMTRTIAAR